LEPVLGKIGGKYKLFLLTAGVISIIFIFCFYIFLPQRAYIAELNTQIQGKQQQVKAIESFVLYHPDVDQYIEELERTLIQADCALPDQLNSSDFMVQIEQISKACGLQLLQIKPSPVVNQNGYRQIPLEINTRGTFFQTINFLTRLEGIPRFNAVTSINMQLQQNLLETKMIVVIFSYGIAVIPQN
jgi:type IV pilus assembly protein PilO